MSLLSKYKFIEFESIDSTNEEAKRLIKSGDISDRTLITSKVQTLGSGRYGKEWISPEGNLYTSIIIKIESSLKDAAKYSFITAVSAGETIEAFIKSDVEVEYKWPNDILLNGKKVSGILLESLQDNNGDSWLVIGVGINVNSSPQAFDKSASNMSYYSLLGVSVDETLVKFIQSFENQEKMWKTNGFACIRAVWLQRAYRLDKEITVNLANDNFRGIFKGISENGELEVLVNGKKLLICSGEVFF